MQKFTQYAIKRYKQLSKSFISSTSLVLGFRQHTQRPERGEPGRLEQLQRWSDMRTRNTPTTPPEEWSSRALQPSIVGHAAQPPRRCEIRVEGPRKQSRVCL